MFKGDVKKYMTWGTFEQPGSLALVIYRRAESVEHIRKNQTLHLSFLFLFCFFLFNLLCDDTLHIRHLPVDRPRIRPSGSSIPLKTLQVFTSHWGGGEEKKNKRVSKIIKTRAFYSNLRFSTAK